VRQHTDVGGPLARWQLIPVAFQLLQQLRYAWIKDLVDHWLVECLQLQPQP
jgi:hypothetical protein